MNQLLTIKDVAMRTSFSPYTIRHWLQKGKLRGYKISKTKYGHWRIKEEDLVEFINGRK